MSHRDLTAEEFLRDVQRHELSVLLDSGIYRHLRLKKPGGSNLWFDIVTWPGVLTIHGDMGTWTFSRVQDMFKFFRDDKLRINKDYWAEKLQHGTHGGRDGAKVWNDDLFKARLREHLANHDLEPRDLEMVSIALEDEVLNRDDKYDLLIAARDFSVDLGVRKFYFDSCELPDGKEYAYHFVWCLYAIVWAIQQYDAQLLTERPQATPLQTSSVVTNKEGVLGVRR